MSLTLKCYTRLSGDRWHAICTDLDIAADGGSQLEARTSLVICVELYLKGAETLPAEDKHRWLTRKAPWYVRAQMALLSIPHRLRGNCAVVSSFLLESDGPTLVQI